MFPPTTKEHCFLLTRAPKTPNYFWEYFWEYSTIEKSCCKERRGEKRVRRKRNRGQEGRKEEKEEREGGRKGEGKERGILIFRTSIYLGRRFVTFIKSVGITFNAYWNRKKMSFGNFIFCKVFLEKWKTKSNKYYEWIISPCFPLRQLK